LNKRALTISAVLAGLLALAGCGKKEEAPKPAAAPAAPSEMTVKIGSTSPLTGPQAHLGKDQENGVKLALEEVNAKGLTLGGKKVKFELQSEDDAADPKTATIVAQKLVDAKVAAVVGHLNSGTTIPASKLYHDAGLVQVSPSATNPDYTNQGFKNAFRVMANDIHQGRALGEYATAKLGAKKIAVVDDKTQYGAGLADQFEKAVKAAGAQVVAREYTTDKSTDFRAILTSVKGKKPDLVFFGGMDTQAGPMAKQMKELGIAAPLMGGDGMQTANFMKLAGPDAENMVASSPGVPLEQMPGGKAFKEKFAKFGEIQLYAPYGYDATMVIIEAMKAADSVESAKVIASLAKLNHNGVTGNINFDDKGDIKNGAVTMYKVKGGKWEVLETVGAAPAAAPAEAAKK
jgi:branched-chain amino acid transport system substrate-binding protein